MTRVGNFQQKNNSVEDGIDATNDHFRLNSGCSAEQKPLGIPFRTLPRKRKKLGIPFRGTKIEAYSQNSALNSSAEEKTTRNSVPWNKNRNKLSEEKQLGTPFCVNKTWQDTRRQASANWNKLIPYVCSVIIYSSLRTE
jgi:hypothetical protein